MVAPQGQGGVVKAIYVQQGSAVRKGQLLLKLDDILQRQALATAQQAVSGAQAQLTLAQTSYERQKNLWSQNIGTEMQVLKAKAEAERSGKSI
ncbi:MAG: biotin/lipoyl-binding protein [Bacteroidota bacterium]